MTLTLRPSHSATWTRCAAAPLYASQCQPRRDNTDDDAAREGTCAAWVAECVLRGDASCAADLIGRSHKNGWLVEPDMAEHVQSYVDMLNARGGVVSAETHVTLFDDPLIAGTLDSSCSMEDTNTLAITDLKYGFRLVEVYENTQLIIYAGAELRRLADPRITHISLEIYQPRAFHPDGIHRKWRITVEELKTLTDWVIERAVECVKPDPIATPGAQCRDCDAVLSCKAVSATLYHAYEVVRAQGLREPTGEELGKEWVFTRLAKKLLESRISALDAEIEHRLNAGQFVKGVTKQQKFGHRKFTVPEWQIEALTGINPYKQVPMSPAELEKAGAPVKAVEQIAKAPSIGYKLTAFTPREIGRAFMDKGE